MCAKYRILFLLSLSPEGSPFLWRPISQLKFKTQKRKNAKCCLQCTDNQCDMICVILRTFGKGAKWGVLRGWFRLFADGWPLIFCNNKSKNAFCFVFGQGSFCLATAPLQFQWKSFSDYPTPFFIAGFSFWFRQENKRTYFEFGQYSYEAYVLVSGLFFTLAFGRWLLAHCIVMLNLVQHLTASRSCFCPRTDPETSSGWHLGMLWAISLLVKGC